MLYASGRVLISNRDEYLKRPATPSQWHSFPSPATFSTDESPSISIAHHVDPSPELSSPSSSSSRPTSSRPVLSGLDAHPSGGGAWLGITKSGKIAAITNFTEIAPPPLPKGRGLEAYRSRGSLTKDWLKREKGKTSSKEDIEDYLDDVVSHIDEWPGFNLLAGQIRVHRDETLTNVSIGYISNRSGETQVMYLDSTSGIGAGGLSNSCLKNPWGKVKKGQHLLDKALKRYDENRLNGLDQVKAEDILSLQLYDILENKVEILNRSSFIESIQIPPIRLAEGNWYATRTATILLVRRNGFVRWWEKDVHVLSSQDEPIRAEELQLKPRHFEWQIEVEEES